MPKLSSAELAKREDVIQKMKKNKRSLVKRYGPDAEKVMYGRATNIAKKVAESEMEKSNLKELIRAALMQEKKKPFPDLTGDGKVTKADILKARGVDLKEETSLQIGDTITINPEAFPSFEFPKGTRGEIIDTNKADYASDDLVYRVKIYHIDGQGDPATELYVEDSNQYLEEDMDLGHTDNEPHMIKGELYRIGKYAMELYNMVDQFEGEGEVDFPAWWQAKITTAKNMVSSAKHYLEFELKEPEIDAMVSVATGEEVIDGENSLMEDEQAILDQVRNKLLGLFQPYGDFKILDMTMKGQNTGENFRLYAKSKGADWKGLETFMRNNPNFTIKHISKQTFDNPKAIDFSYTTSIMEEEISAEEKLAAAIQKALNKNKSADDQNNIRQARKAMNDGNIEAAKKILQPYLEEGNLGHNELASLEKEGGSWIVTYRTMDGKKEKVFTDEDEARAFMNTTLEEGLPKGYFKKATAELDESFEKLVGKLKKGGKSEKAAKAIAGAVANYKAKGGGKGPTAKQKARG